MTNTLSFLFYLSLQKTNTHSDALLRTFGTPHLQYGRGTHKDGVAAVPGTRLFDDSLSISSSSVSIAAEEEETERFFQDGKPVDAVAVTLNIRDDDDDDDESPVAVTAEDVDDDVPADVGAGG